MTIAGLLLAAGASTRTGFPKALARVGKKTFAELGVEMLSGLDELVVVVGAPHGAQIRRVLPGLRFAENLEPARGMLSSLQLGISTFGSEVEAVVVALIDHPHVKPATVAALVEAWRSSTSSVLKPRWRGRGGHPFVIARTAFEALRAAPPTASTRDVLRQIGGISKIELCDPAVLDDLDTPEAIELATSGLPP